jgi:hypothetical protein
LRGNIIIYKEREREREREEKRREEKRVDDGGISIEFKTT